MEQKPGFRFHPTDEELINYYLTNKNLGKSWLVEDVISEINLYDHDPNSLPLLSRIKSKYPVYYFFAPTQYTNAKKSWRKRSTKSGFWKPTGKVKKIKDKRGKKKHEIGEKRVLVYHVGKAHNSVKTPWVMHEYQILHHHPDSYVICKIFDNAEEEEEEDISNGINSSEPSQSLVSDLSTFRSTSTLPEVEQSGEEVFYDSIYPMIEQEDIFPWYGSDPNTSFIDNNSNVQPQAPCNDEYWRELLGFNGGSFEDVFSDQELITQENHNDYRPKKSLSGIILDYSNDSDAESATSYQGTSSPNDSIGSSNRHFASCGNKTLSLSTYYSSCKDVQTYYAEPSISRKIRESQLARRTIPSKQEVKQGLVKTEKKGLGFITEEAMERNRKHPRISIS